MHDSGMGAALGLVFFLIIFGLGLAVALFYGYCLKLIAEKTGHGDETGLWWLPVVNWLIPIRIAERPDWWLLLYFVPFAGLVVHIVIWMEVGEALGRDKVASAIAAAYGVVGIPYLAFSTSDSTRVAFDAD
ncbi:MAG: hypothetical protein JWQ98_954 [Chlorobi bacterium]|jgi:hypothetical protein|nr:hypothetical protein [Chlorobiota bacterium]